MNVVLLSGGSGKRLWPLSNEIRSKQFIKIFKNDRGEYESMVQRVYSQIKEADPDATITVATSKSQVSALRHQLGDGINISVEPSRRDTFPAIVLASVYLHYKKGVALGDAIVVCPVDPYVEIEYFSNMKELVEIIESDKANLALMGIEPTYPSEKYGYIIPSSSDRISSVSQFKEKPDKETAEKYISQGALWNCGVFAFSIGYILEKAHELMDFTDYDDLFAKYSSLEKISFDYAVVEKEESIAVLRCYSQWKDIGTWNTLTEAMSENSIGKVHIDESCRNVHVINELSVPVVCMGLKDVIVSASPEGVLVSDNEMSSYIKPIVDSISDEIHFAEKSWGSFLIIDSAKNALTIKVTLNAGNKMHYHYHEHRDESYTVIKGKGRLVIDGEEISLAPGVAMQIPRLRKHTVIADEDIVLIEVQTGDEISKEDKIIVE